MTSAPLPLLLASSSPARRQLLDRLGLPFRTASPDIDETPHPGEPVTELVQRLSEAKARALADACPNHLVIGSDQALTLDNEILGKPGTADRARAQLARLSGRRVTFHTGLCLLNTSSGHCQVLQEEYAVQFRTLDAATIARYVERDEPWGCAGSFKAEGLGITLFHAFEGRDPNTLVGLPLMALTDLLLNEGLLLP
ncbi:MAG TPA: nucleoside triphosphate pyrophosphatase [Moraxellaceae bacterium]|nr:nucleoside triphosphate pyrophosphatase [Moraxellaceae bacterium]